MPIAAGEIVLEYRRPRQAANVADWSPEQVKDRGQAEEIVSVPQRRYGSIGDDRMRC